MPGAGWVVFRGQYRGRLETRPVLGVPTDGSCGLRFDFICGLGEVLFVAMDGSRKGVVFITALWVRLEVDLGVCRVCKCRRLTTRRPRRDSIGSRSRAQTCSLSNGINEASEYAYPPKLLAPNTSASVSKCLQRIRQCPVPTRASYAARRTTSNNPALSRPPATLPRRLERSIPAPPIYVLNLPAVPPATFCTRVASRAPTPVSLAPLSLSCRSANREAECPPPKKSCPDLDLSECQSSCRQPPSNPDGFSYPTLGRASRGGVHTFFLHVACLYAV